MDTRWSRDHVALSTEFVLQPGGTRATQHSMASSSQAVPGLSDIPSLGFVSWSWREGSSSIRQQSQIPASLQSGRAKCTVHSSEGTCAAGCPSALPL